MQRIHDTIFKLDSKKKTRIWFMEQEDNKYRTTSGLADGKQTTTAWTIVGGKNLGRSNETSGEEQATSEVEAHYAKKLRVDYHHSIETIKEDKIFKPMLAAKWEDVQGKIDYAEQTVFVQPKLDGIRCIATKDGMFTRGGKVIYGAPHINEELIPLFEKFPELILDGELYNHELKDDFNQIVSMVKKAKPNAVDLDISKDMVQYHVYDCAVSGLSFSERYADLQELLGEADPYTIVCVDTKVATNEVEIDDIYARYIELGYEGGIVRLDGEYQQKRSNLLLKRKDFDDEEFEITRIEEGKGNWSGVAKRVFFRDHQNGNEECGAGLAGDRESAREILMNADEYIGKKVTIQFFKRTPDGVPRFPIAKALHKNERW